MKLHKLFFICLGLFLGMGLYAKDLKDARIYVNPGHGGWGANDRNLATINYALGDTLGFYETNTNLHKGFALRDELVKAGAGYVKMSRTMNGVAPNSQSTLYPHEKYERDLEDQMVTLTEIAAYVETNNFDYFISIHSNAATEGSTSNYPLLLYRGTDTAVGNGLVEARNMALDAWKYVVKNDVTYHSHYTLPSDNNARGDVSFMNGGNDQPLGYYGYYAVLKHSVDGYLSEGCFHTYQPERQRLLNPDYCRQEGIRYARALRAWFGDDTETQGSIMGTIKDISEPLTHSLYNYAVNSMDAYKPLNKVTVTLQTRNGEYIGEYETDEEYNGIFVFNDLTPGIYKLIFDIEGYWSQTKEIEVFANETSFINQRMTDLSLPEPVDEEEEPEVEYYLHPEQDGDLIGAKSYNFEEEYVINEIEALKELTVRRAILRDNKYYILALDENKEPKLMVLDPTNGEVIKNMSTEGISWDGYNGEKHLYALSDIAFTNDGVLMGINSTVVGITNNSFQTGDFYVYKWEATQETPLEDAIPEIFIKMETNTYDSQPYVGNNNSNLVGNSMAINGDFENFTLYFDSHAGNGWTTTYGIRYVCWIIRDGNIIGYKHNNATYNESQLGEDVRMTLSPLKVDRLILDGNTILPREIGINWESTELIEGTEFVEDELSIESVGANYFRYAGRIYMSTPIVNTSDYSYRVYLYDITGGLDHANKIGETEPINGTSLTSMAATGVVDNADIDLYLLIGTKLVKFTTKNVEQPVATARIFAYNLKSVSIEDGYEISFDLNEDADSVELLLIDETSGEIVETIELGALNKGNNKTSIPDSKLPETGAYYWSIKATAGSVTHFTKISDDVPIYKYFAPKGVAVDKSPESEHFGRVYITNTTAGSVENRETSAGIYIVGPNGEDITGQGNDPYTGGIGWVGSSGAESPCKIAVAEDGRVFISDASVANAGIYFMDPATFEITPVFQGAVNNSGSLMIGSEYIGGQITAIGVRGIGENTQLYAVDKTASGQTWRKHVYAYNIGENNVWNQVPSAASNVTSTYIGNDNNSIAPVSTGYWAGQYRGAGGNSSGNPCLYYYCDKEDKPVYNSAEPMIISTSSQNGGMSVNEAEGVIALSNDGGLSVFHYVMDGKGIPVVTEKFWKSLSDETVTYDDFEFDYAGNLYAVSHSGKLVSVWGMPIQDNTTVVPALPSMKLVKGTKPVHISDTPLRVKNIYPNPVIDKLTIEVEGIINRIDIYSVEGTLVNQLVGVNSSVVTVDLSNNVSGMYFIKVDNEKAIKVMKK